MPRGTLAVRTNVEGARVIVDNSLRGTTGKDGALQTSLDAGSHQVRVFKDGYLAASPKSVEIMDNRSCRVDFKLEAIPAPHVEVAKCYITVKAPPE